MKKSRVPSVMVLEECDLSHKKLDTIRFLIDRACEEMSSCKDSVSLGQVSTKALMKIRALIGTDENPNWIKKLKTKKEK